MTAKKSKTRPEIKIKVKIKAKSPEAAKTALKKIARG